MAAIIISKATGLLKWSQTSSTLRENAAHLYPFIHGEWTPVSRFDFGIGAEKSAICPECHRKIPIATSTVDHKIPQSWMEFRNVEIKSRMTLGSSTLKNFEYNNDRFIVFETGSISLIYSEDGITRRASYTVHANRRTIQINDTSLSYDIIKVIKNNLSNLQYMCHSCNAKKGDR